MKHTQIKEAADYVRGQIHHQPTIGLILGSGLSPLADEIEAADRIPYANIPHFPVSGVAGHAGKLVVGRLAGQARELKIFRNTVKKYVLRVKEVQAGLADEILPKNRGIIQPSRVLTEPVRQKMP